MSNYDSTALNATTYTGKPAYQEPDFQAYLIHHYKVNGGIEGHHPDETGIKGMSLLGILEMLCDWKAAVERHADGDFVKSRQINYERFKFSDQLIALFENTVKELGW